MQGIQRSGSRKISGRFDRSFWYPAVTGVAGVLITIVMSSLLTISEHRLVEEFTEASANGMKEYLKSSIELRLLVFHGFSERWNTDRSISEAEWEREANGIVRDVGGLSGIEWSQRPDGSRWLSPASLKGLPEMNLASQFEVEDAVIGEVSKGGSILSGPLDLPLGGRGFLAEARMGRGRPANGDIIGMFLYRELFRTVFSSLSDDFQVHVFHDGEEVYQFLAPGGIQEGIRKEADFGVLNSHWRIVLWPSRAAVASRSGRSSNWVLALGILLSFLFASRVHASQAARNTALRAQETLVALQEETTEREKAERAFRTLVEATSSTTGEEFFTSLVEALSQALDVPLCFIGEIHEGEPLRIRTIAFWCDGKLTEAMEYEVPGTPCEHVLKNRTAHYPTNLQKRFPEDRWLVEAGVVSYFGTALHDSAGKLIGLLSVMDRQPIGSRSLVQYLVPLFASRSAAEMERVRAKMALAQSERIYREAIENASGVPYLHRYEGESYDFVGDGIRQLLGVRPEDFSPAFLKEHVREIRIIDPAGTTNPKEYGLRFRRGEFPRYRADFLIVLPDGQEKWISDSAVLLWDEKTGQPMGDLGVMQDITERRMADEAFRRHAEEIAEWNRRYDAAVEATRQVLYDWDPQTNKMTWGALMQSTLGIPPAEVGEARDWWEELMHPADRAEVRRAIHDAQVKRAPFRIEYRIRRRDGVYTHVEDSGSFFLTKDGVLDRAVGFISDISEQKKAEEERRSLEGKIQQAQKLESLGVLAGGIAHDFNNLLVAILGNAGLALMELRPESPARPVVEQIERAAQRAAELANQMLAYSGKGRFVIQQLDLTALVDEMTHLLEISISKKAMLRYNLSTSLPPIEGDATQIRQIVMNLVTNASDAIGERSGVINVSTGMLHVDARYLKGFYLDENLGEGYYVYIEVSDTGCGMDAATREKIFEPFFTTKATGRGLGLAALLGIVRGHKGGVKVSSELRRGTTFRILLPCLVSSSSTENVKLPSRNGEAIPTLGGVVLVADDEETVRTVARHILERAGFQVILARDGREAVKLFKEQSDSIRVVLMDMTMPHMGGAEAFREMRRHRPDVRVILTSGYNEQEAVDRFAGKGLAGFIQKPYRPNELIEKFREVLSETKADG